MRTMTNESPSRINYPEVVTLTDKELKQIEQTTQLYSWIWILCTFYLIYFFKAEFIPILISYDFSTKTIGMLCLSGLSMLLGFVLLLLFYWYGFTMIRKNRQDRKDGVKHVGIVEILLKEYYYDSDGADSYHVTFKWKSGDHQKSIFINHKELFKALEIGEKAYIELLPNSNELLHFCKA